MSNIVLSRDDPFSTPCRWGIASRDKLLRDEDGRFAMFHNRGAAERHVELFCLHNGNALQLRAVPLPFTLRGITARALGTFIQEAFDGSTDSEQWGSALDFAEMYGIDTGAIGDETRWRTEEMATIILERLRSLGITV